MDNPLFYEISDREIIWILTFWHGYGTRERDNKRTVYFKNFIQGHNMINGDH